MCGDVVDSRKELSVEHLAVAHHAADRDAAEADAVIAALATDQHAAGAFPPHAMVSDGDLERGVHRLGSRVDEEHMVHALGRDLHQAIRRQERPRAVHLEAGGVVHALGLLLDRIHDRLAAVARVHRPQARDSVQDLASVVSGVVHVLGGHQQARRCLELAVGGEWQPERLEIQLGEKFLFAGTHSVLQAVRPPVREMRPARPMITGARAI